MTPLAPFRGGPARPCAALTLAKLRDASGLAAYREVLERQRELLAAEIELAGTNRDQLIAVVRVYKAPGGGWALVEARAATC